MAELWDNWATHLPLGDRILWQGAPLPGIRNRGRLVFMSLFGVPFLIFGLAGTGVALRHLFWLGDVGIGVVTLALGFLFLVFGYAFVFGQWVAAARAHQTTRYALSTRCAYVARKTRGQTRESYPILPATAVELELGDGYDNVWFHVRRERDSDGDLTTNRVGFEGIADGAKVYQLMRAIQTGQI